LKADKIDSFLICVVCDNKMVDPRLLPCGNSVCHRCVDFLADTEKKRIKCENCAKIHEMPDDGFPKNLSLQELLEFAAKEVFHPNHKEEFKKLLDALEATTQSIESTLECGDVKIRDHCDKVRNHIQLAIEQPHAKLDDIHKDFMDEIDNYENKCQEKFKLIQQNKTDIKKALNESNLLLKQFKIEHTELSTFFESAHYLLNNLDQSKMGFKEICLTSLYKNLKYKKLLTQVL
jgi:hypothetical protein